MSAHTDRLKRLRLRSWRRGTKEMDLLLGPFADAFLGAMPQDEMARYERLLQEDDQTLYEWMTGRTSPPRDLAPLVARIARYAEDKFAQQSDVL
jgi:antitoxin CptB